MTPTDPTTLAAWLPILQHPEVGERVCRAAGCLVSSGVDLDGSPAIWLWWDYEQDSGLDTLTTAESAALAFGVLSVLAGYDGEGWLCCYDEPDEWAVMDYEGYQRGYGATLPAAVLAAARRVWCE